MIRYCALVTLFLGLALFVTTAHAEKRTVNIVIQEELTKVEVDAWTAYGLGLGDWVKKKQLADSAPDGPFLPSFDAELHARQMQLQIWKELNEKEEQSLPYMDALLKVESAGFLREYVWYFYRRSEWGEKLLGLRAGDFKKWQVENLKDHVPQTKARIIFGPKPKS